MTANTTTGLPDARALVAKLRDWAPPLTAVRKDCLEAADMIEGLLLAPPAPDAAVPAGAFARQQADHWLDDMQTPSLDAKHISLVAMAENCIRYGQRLASDKADVGIFATDNADYMRLTGTGDDDARLFDVRLSRGAAETLMHEIGGLLQKPLTEAMQAEFLRPTVKQDYRDERGEPWEEGKDVARLKRQHEAPKVASEGAGLRLREYLLMRCDQNERAGSTKVRVEIADLRKALATDATDGATGGGEGFLEAIHEATPAGEWITVRHTPNGDWAVRNPPHKAFGGYGTDVDMGEELTFTPDDREKAAILSLCADQELSPTAVMRQALRLYQHDHCRRKDGETVTWSGDDQRARDFAGPTATTTGADLLEQAARYREALEEIAKGKLKQMPDGSSELIDDPDIDPMDIAIRALSARNLTDGGEK